MTENTRNNYTTAFKREAVRMVTDEGYKATEAAIARNGHDLWA